MNVCVSMSKWVIYTYEFVWCLLFYLFVVKHGIGQQACFASQLAVLLNPDTTVAQLLCFSWLLGPWRLCANLGCSSLDWRWLQHFFAVIHLDRIPFSNQNSLVELLQFVSSHLGGCCQHSPHGNLTKCDHMQIIANSIICKYISRTRYIYI